MLMTHTLSHLEIKSVICNFWILLFHYSSPKSPRVYSQYLNFYLYFTICVFGVCWVFLQLSEEAEQQNFAFSKSKVFNA